MYESIDELKLLCDTYNYSIKEKYGLIYISTKYEKWYFTMTQTGMIRLYHQNGFKKQCSDYHKQFTRKMNLKSLVDYIHQHEIYRYGPAWVLAE